MECSALVFHPILVLASEKVPAGCPSPAQHSLSGGIDTSGEATSKASLEVGLEDVLRNPEPPEYSSLTASESRTTFATSNFQTSHFQTFQTFILSNFSNLSIFQTLKLSNFHSYIFSNFHFSNFPKSQTSFLLAIHFQTFKFSNVSRRMHFNL